MHEIHRALIVLLVLTLPFLWVAQRFVCPALMTAADYRRRSGVWIAILVAACLIPSFWGFMVVSGLFVLVALKKESRPLSLFVMVLCVVPPISVEIPGFMGINQLFSLNYPRVLSLALLLPAWFALSKNPAVLPLGRHPCDVFVLGFAALQLVLQLPHDSITEVGRAGLHLTLDILLPYCVASRALRNIEDWRDFLGSFVLGILILSPIAAFEFGRQWLLLNSLAWYWEVHGWSLGGYLMRGSSLRALASSGHSLVLGYMMVIALALSPYIAVPMARFGRWAVTALVAVGLLVPLARGPWIGAVVVIAVLLVSTPLPRNRLSHLVSLGALLAVGISFTPLADRIIDMLPFVGTVDSYNVDYRSRLLEAAWIVIQMNPWFGSTTYLSTPQMLAMIQGEGIVDLVNIYVSVALDYGVVGLTIFCGAFLFAILGITKKKKRTDLSNEEQLLGGCLLAALAGILVVIATLSSILNVPTLYSLVTGLAVSYALMPAQKA